ncbi:MAG: gliding motility protein GldM [Odoribacter sp.]|nr:gliding motility protein GldM [Odoribacter sp.]
MSAKNCPETPRQKMIGMMYLVLTAMLALNVSADVLDAFTKVQDGLASTIESFSKKNAEAYNEIEMAYNINAAKMGDVRANALVFRKETDELLSYIDSLKLRLVKIADGEDGDVNNIQSKDNLDIGGQVMITQKQGAELKQRLTKYREQALSLINEKDSVLRGSVQFNLDTQNPPAVQGEIKTWESSKFENIPLIGVVTLLTMYQTNILNVESDVVRYLLSSIDAESFKFNKLEALVIPESQYVFSGDEFRANIMLAAVDTTQQPEIIINNKKVDYKGDFGYYTESTSRVGKYTVEGVINYVSPAGVTLPRTFEMEYEVMDPAVVISPTKMNVFYLGVDNPIDFAVPGLSQDAIQLEISNGTITKVGSEYIVRPAQVGKKCEITLYANTGGQRRKLQTQEFRVKEVPNPVAKIAGNRGGAIRKNVLLAGGGLEVEMEGFDFDMKFTVQSFNMYTVVGDGYVESARSNGVSFTSEQTKLINNLKRNQLLIVDQIVVKGPDGISRELASLSYRIE